MPNRVVHWWRQWRTLSSWEQRTVLSLIVRLVRIAPLLRRQPLAAVLAGIDATPVKRQPLPTGVSAIEFVSRCARLTDIAAHHGFYLATCLPRSVVLYQLLHEYGLPARLRLGVQSSAEPLQAHAWVECADLVIGDGTGYQPFPELGKAGNA